MKLQFQKSAAKNLVKKTAMLMLAYTMATGCGPGKDYLNHTPGMQSDNRFTEDGITYVLYYTLDKETEEKRPVAIERRTKNDNLLDGKDEVPRKSVEHLTIEQARILMDMYTVPDSGVKLSWTDPIPLILNKDALAIAQQEVLVND